MKENLLTLEVETAGGRREWDCAAEEEGLQLRQVCATGYSSLTRVPLSQQKGHLTRLKLQRDLVISSWIQGKGETRDEDPERLSVGLPVPERLRGREKIVYQTEQQLVVSGAWESVG